MKKQIRLSILFIMLMSMTGLSVMAHDIEVVNADGITIYYKYNNYEQTELAVVYRGNYMPTSENYAGNVVIPEEVNYMGKTLRVTGIGSSAFNHCSSLISVTIPNSVTNIKDYAFNYCTSLTSVNIPTSVTSIGGYIFNCCSSLKTVDIPNSVTRIGYGSFLGCTSLTSITIPNSVTSIEGMAFYNCI